MFNQWITRSLNVFKLPCISRFIFRISRGTSNQPARWCISVFPKHYRKNLKWSVTGCFELLDNDNEKYCAGFRVGYKLTETLDDTEPRNYFIYTLSQKFIHNFQLLYYLHWCYAICIEEVTGCVNEEKNNHRYLSSKGSRFHSLGSTTTFEPIGLAFQWQVAQPR